MKQKDFVIDSIEQFSDGLRKALNEGSDTFSFEFDSHDLPGMQTAIEQKVENVPMTCVVLMRPRIVADAMLQAMQQAREELLAGLEANAPKS